MAVSVVVAVGDIADDLVNKIKERMPNLIMGKTDCSDTQLGPVISMENKERIYSFIDTAESEGATLSVDGRKLSDGKKVVLLDPR
jgi:malonate-semialdehyde dehydrogenase (acetylating)/methylmalonate-semialdehyde dehydrogenase